MSDGRFIIQTFVARARWSVRMCVYPGCLLRNRIIRNAGPVAPPPPPPPPPRVPPVPKSHVRSETIPISFHLPLPFAIQTFAS